MTIEIIKGCLLEAFDKGEMDAIGHCCNQKNKFGSGIAKSIKERFPKAYEADTAWYKSGVLTPLSCVTYLVKDSDDQPYNKYIFNLYGQEYYGKFGDHYKRTGRQLNYGALVIALLAMRGWLDSDSVVGFPYKMGCDRAGGNWEIVLEIIQDIFKYHTVKIYQLEN